MSEVSITEALAEQAVREVLGHDSAVRSLELLKRRPEKHSAVFRADVEFAEGASAFGVKFVRRRAAAIFRDWRSLYSVRSGFEVPEPIGVLPNLDCIVYRWAGGPEMKEVLREDGPGCIERPANAVVAIHSCGAPLSRRFDARDEMTTLMRWIDRASSVGHPRGVELCAVARGLSEPAEEEAPPLSPGHRDCYPSQMLATYPATFLDLESAALCEPALDMGNFAAHLIVDGLADLVEPFLRGCLGADGPRMARVEFYRTTTLLRLSAVYWVRGRRELALTVPVP